MTHEGGADTVSVEVAMDGDAVDLGGLWKVLFKGDEAGVSPFNTGNPGGKARGGGDVTACGFLDAEPFGDGTKDGLAASGGVERWSGVDGDGVGKHGEVVEASARPRFGGA